MARIDYAVGERATWKYPWDQMTEVGDYFDIPPGNEVQARGVRNAAYHQTGVRSVVFVTRTLYDGSVRVMLIEKWPAAQVGRRSRKRAGAHG